MSVEGGLEPRESVGAMVAYCLPTVDRDHVGTTSITRSVSPMVG